MRFDSVEDEEIIPCHMNIGVCEVLWIQSECSVLLEIFVGRQSSRSPLSMRGVQVCPIKGKCHPTLCDLHGNSAHLRLALAFSQAHTAIEFGRHLQIVQVAVLC